MKNIKKGEVIQLSENFKSSEFDCKGKNCCSSGIIDEKLIEWLQKIRNHFGVSITVNSGFRCSTHNAKVGGSSSSHHMKGMAADIVVKGKTPREVAQYAEKIGIQRIGLYETDKDGYFVHIGSGTTKRFWYGQAGKEVTTFQTTLNPTVTKPTVSGEVYRVRTSWDNAASQVGAYNSLENAKKACDKAGKGYEVYNSKGVAVYPVQTEDPNPTLRKGAKGAKVKEVQTLLTNLGFPCARDGSFGSATQQQVIAFQKDRNLAKDGVVGPKTWAALRAFTPYKVAITADRLNVRAGASTKFKVIAQVKKNDIYTIIKKSGNWGLLKSRKGWISLNYTKKV